MPRSMTSPTTRRTTPSINCWESRMIDRRKYLDRAGGRVYFRISGMRQRLPDDENSPEFAAAYDALIAGRMLPKPKRAARPAPNAPGSIGWFIEQYLASEIFCWPRWPQAKVFARNATELSAYLGSYPYYVGTGTARRSHARQCRRLSGEN
jgi:hypothetical protein